MGSFRNQEKEETRKTFAGFPYSSRPKAINTTALVLVNNPLRASASEEREAILCSVCVYVGGCDESRHSLGKRRSM